MTGGGIYGVKARNVVCTVYDTGDFSIRPDPRVAQKVRTSVDVIFLLGYDERGQQKKKEEKTGYMTKFTRTLFCGWRSRANARACVSTWEGREL